MSQRDGQPAALVRYLPQPGWSTRRNRLPLRTSWGHELIFALGYLSSSRYRQIDQSWVNESQQKMTNGSTDMSELLRRAAGGDEDALNRVYSQYHGRLKRMVCLRLSPRLQGRVDASDVLQESYLEVSRRLADYVSRPALPVFLWLRHITVLKLAELHRRHLGTQMRDANRELSLHRGTVPTANSASLAAQLVGNMTSPSQAAIKAEMRVRLHDALNVMDPVDREVLALRHFEQLSNAETAEVLGLSKSGTSDRHIRAIKRLRGILAEFPGFSGA